MVAIQEAWQALKLGGAVVYPLLALALVAMVIMLDKAYLYGGRVRLPQAFRDLLGRPDIPWPDVESALRQIGSDHPLAGFYATIVSNRLRPVWWVESRAGEASMKVQAELQRGLWVLETIVTAAPLLGLLGTITGMMQSFRLIGGGGLVEPTKVTAGVAEALIATAFGLLIALVALFGYNFFTRRQAECLDEMEQVGTRLVDQIRLDQETGGVLAGVSGGRRETP